MKRKFLADISLNMLQLLIVQACGLVVFYLLSTTLSKNEFGEINWALAVLLTCFGIIAFGIDQVVVKRVAAGNAPAQLLSVYMSHVTIAGSLFYIVLWVGSLLFPQFFDKHPALLLLGAGKLMIFVSTAFKQIVTGLEKFRSLLGMAITSNVLRAVILIVFAWASSISFKLAITVFVITDMLELLLCILIMKKYIGIPVSLSWDRAAYKNLLRESLPQFGVAVFSSALARLDWILLGLLTSNIVLAEYSFAYKVFEMATLPLLVIAPVLIPRFTRLFSPHTLAIGEERKNDLLVLLRIEIVIASLTGLLLNICWTPFIDMLTSGKYGAVNQVTVMLLSASLPFLYFNNFMWTINFARGRLTMILYIFLWTFIINLAGDVSLIPFFKAEGAAAGYLAAIIAQAIFYLYRTTFAGISHFYYLLVSPAAAVTSYVLIITICSQLWMQLMFAPALYVCLLLILRHIRRSHWHAIRRVTGL